MHFRGSLLLLVTLLLSACAGHGDPAAAGRAAPVDAAALRLQASALPGAELDEAGPLTIRYPGETLFRKGAALPLAGGTETLGPLAELLRAHPGARWQAAVRGDGGVSADHQRTLAEARAELLGRYFKNRGIAEPRVEISAEAGEGAPLEITLRER